MGNLGKKPKKSHYFPMLVTELYSSLLNGGLIAPIVPKLVTNLPEWHKIQSLIDIDALIFEGAT